MPRNPALTRLRIIQTIESIRLRGGLSYEERIYLKQRIAKKQRKKNRKEAAHEKERETYFERIIL